MLSPIYIVSSNIDAIGYEPDALFIRFKSGQIYRYDGVPHVHFDALQKVESAGQYFHHYIRSKFRYERLPQDPFVH